MHNPCAKCGKLNDLEDYDFCSGCCYEMAFWEREPKIAGFSLKGAIARRLGIGTAGVFCIVSTEAALTHIMHHPVILPTPIGYEMADISGRFFRHIHERKDSVMQNPVVKEAVKAGTMFGLLNYEIGKLGFRCMKAGVKKIEERREKCYLQSTDL